MRLIHIPLLGGLLLLAVTANATIFGSVQGLIHDPGHRPVPGAQVTLRSANSDWAKNVTSDSSGEFRFDTVPLGEYQVKVEVPGFATQEQKLVLTSGRDARLHFSLTVAQTKETVEVTDTPATVNPESSTTSAVVSREQISHTPGADQTNSMAMITNYTPGAYMVHDQLHIRGGHQVSWLLDGVPVPNTNIASNVGPQFDPKDIDYLEVQRGGYNAEYGDRTYGVFNVVTRSGFERNRQAEIVASYGSYNNTNDQISFGDHTERFAYYGSFSGYRTDLGLETPIPQVIHDQAAGMGGFASLIFNKTPTDQLRLITSVRGDHYQVPQDPNASADEGFVGIGDVEDERDALVNFSWLHTAGPGLVLTVSPFYHFNRAHYLGGPLDQPVSPEDDRGSSYVGGVVSLAWTQRRHTLRTGIQIFGQRDNELFAIASSDPAQLLPPQRKILWGNVETFFLEDQFKLTSWLTVNGGVRLTHFGATISENAADPRIGAAVRIPKLNWVARAFYGRYYQAPPLLTVGGPLIDLCRQQDCGFLPLHGERDEQHEFGLTIPLAGWTFDVANFRTGARNFFDHDALGNSNIFFPLTLEHARIRGWETTATSPRIAGRAQFHFAYSHQYAQWSGGITGGLITDASCEGPLCFLDHDQRDSFSTGFNLALPWRAWTDFNVNYGSGFLDGEGPQHLPAHTTYDLSLGKSFGERWTVRLTGLNLASNRYLLDNANTFGGTHYVNPLEVSIQIKYRFRF
ncbi:MAG: TonB-dependent receptor [Acidobacteriia bacterium]|nr:TonB-dependent receptor [Terriglobia bacterium]